MKPVSKLKELYEKRDSIRSVKLSDITFEDFVRLQVLYQEVQNDIKYYEQWGVHE